jgi:nicotinamide-nucleotide amidase
MIPSTHQQQVIEIGDLLTKNQLRLGTAESCTGGLLAGAFTEVPGASLWYEGGFVTYRLSAKQKLLGISKATLDTYGAVSEVVARAMAEQVLKHSNAHVSVATTGLAGPQGDGTNTAVGTLWIAWALASTKHRWVQAEKFEIHAPRGPFREAAVALAVEGLLARLLSQPLI